MICKNCKTALPNDADYCLRCGGRIIRNRLTFKNLFEHISETFLNYDNKLLRTFIGLIIDPLDVIDGYVNGVRKKYVNPLSLFGLSLTLSGLSIFILNKFYIEDIDFSMFLFDERGAESFNKIQEGLFEYNAIFYSFLIPFFALISWLVFLNKKYNYTEHIVLFFYTMSMFSIVSVFVSQILLWIDPQAYAHYGIWSFLVLFAYHCQVYKRIFSLTWGGLALRILLFLGIFLISYIGISIVAFIVLIFTGTVNLEDFAPK